jgi:hypothetical protein
LYISIGSFAESGERIGKVDDTTITAGAFSSVRKYFPRSVPGN